MLNNMCLFGICLPLITFVFGICLPLIVFIVCISMPYFPMIFDHKGYLIWKKCYNTDNFYLCHDSNISEYIIKTYKSKKLPYEIITFIINNEISCVIFDENNNVLFGNFFKRHSYKLCEKLKTIN